MGSELWGEKIDGGWYNDASHCYRDEAGIVLPSVTGVFDALGLSDFSGIDPAVLEWKRQYGTALHRGVELLVAGNLDWDSVDDALIPALTGIEQWLRQVEYQPVAQEEKKIIVLNSMRVGGILDLRGSLVFKGRRRPCILDIKTGAKFSPTWIWQIGAYSGGAPKIQGDVYIGAALQVDREGDVKPHWVDVVKSLREFIILLAAANLAANAKLVKFKNSEEE